VSASCLIPLARAHHALSSLCCALISQQKSAAPLEEVGNILDIEAEIVQEDFEDMQDGIRLRDFALGELRVKADILWVVSDWGHNSEATYLEPYTIEFSH
jgi:hypothetical protein